MIHDMLTFRVEHFGDCGDVKIKTTIIHNLGVFVGELVGLADDVHDINVVVAFGTRYK